MTSRSLHARIREEQWEHLQSLAERHDVSVGWLVRRAIDYYLNQSTNIIEAEDK